MPRPGGHRAEVAIVQAFPTRSGRQRVGPQVRPDPLVLVYLGIMARRRSIGPGQVRDFHTGHLMRAGPVKHQQAEARAGR